MICLSKHCKTGHWTPNLIFIMAGRRSARISSRTSIEEPGVVGNSAPDALNPSFVADSLVNGVGTVSAVQKRRLSATVAPQQESSTKKSKSKKAKKENTKPQQDDGAVFAVPAIPITPNKKRRPAPADAPIAPPPSTPTPSEGNLIANNNPNADPATLEPKKTPRQRRRVDPHATNAPLQTPGGTRLTSYPSSILESGSQTPLGSQQSDVLTTDNLLKTACAHLVSIDPRLKPIIDQHHCRLFSPEGLSEEVDPFMALASGIIGQQVHIQTRPSSELLGKKAEMLSDSPANRSRYRVLQHRLSKPNSWHSSRRRPTYLRAPSSSRHQSRSPSWTFLRYARQDCRSARLSTYKAWRKSSRQAS